jgi:hypothetical protein
MITPTPFNHSAFAFLLTAILALSACAPKPRSAPADPPPTPTPLTPPTPAPSPSPAASSTPTPLPPVSTSGPSLIEVFPHVRIDRAAGLLEFDAVIPLDAHDPITPIVYLELVCCAPDTREHESLVMTRALPSHIHAGLLLLGLESGTPGLVDFRGSSVIGRPPTGPDLSIEFEWLPAAPADSQATPRIDTPATWIRQHESAAPLGTLPEGPGVWGPLGGWVFAGSRIVTRPPLHASGTTPVEVYDADGTGTIIGLTTFGSEVIAWKQILSPDAGLTAPVWVINPTNYPPVGTRVIVRVRRA